MEDKENRTKMIMVRMSEQEKAEFEADARKLHMGISDFVRHLWAKFRGY